MKRVELLSGINLNVISDEKFKTNSVSINFITPLTKEDVTVNAILPNLLEKGYDGCSDFIEFNHKLEELYGASAQSFIQKVGDYQIVTIYATAIDDKFTLNKESITNELCSIVCKMAFNPIFKDGMFLEKEVELEKQTLCDIISSEINDKGTYAILKGISEMCSDEPYGIYKNGFIDKAKEITAKSATEAYKNLVKKSRIEIMFVGCGNPQEEIFKNAVSQLDRQYTQLAPISMHIKSQKEEIVNRMNVNQAKLFMGMGSDLKNNDSATKIMATILGGSPTSKFFVNVREKLSLCYYCSCMYDRFKNIIAIESGVEPQNIEKAKEAIKAQFNDMVTGNVTQKEVESAFLCNQNRLKTVYDSVYALSSWYLAQIIDGNIQSPKEQIEELKKVTVDDVVNAAKSFSFDTTYVLREGGNA